VLLRAQRGWYISTGRMAAGSLLLAWHLVMVAAAQIYAWIHGCCAPAAVDSIKCVAGPGHCGFFEPPTSVRACLWTGKAHGTLLRYNACARRGREDTFNVLQGGSEGTLPAQQHHILFPSTLIQRHRRVLVMLLPTLWFVCTLARYAAPWWQAALGGVACVFWPCMGTTD
jgi:hypothetical protein